MKAQFIRGGDSMNSLQIGRSKYKESFELIEKIVNSIFEKYPFDPKEKQEFIDREEEVAGITFMGTMKKISQKKIINSPCEYFVAIVDFAKSRKHYFMGYNRGDGKWISHSTDSPDICLDQIKAWIKKGPSGQAF